MKPALTLEAFADWCEKQPADEVYDYHSTRHCAVAQYMATLGLSAAFEDWWGEAETIASQDPSDFGALALRLRTALSEAVQP